MISTFRAAPYIDGGIGKHKLVRYSLDRASGIITESDVASLEPNNIYLGHNVVSSSDGRYTILPAFVRSAEEVKDANYPLKEDKKTRWYLIDESGNTKDLT